MYTCETCDKTFKTKTDYVRHQNRKIPCDGKSLEEKVAEAVVKVLKDKGNLDIEEIKPKVSTDVVMKLVDYMHNLMREKDQMTGTKAYHDINKLLFLRFIQPYLHDNGRLSSLLDLESYKDSPVHKMKESEKQKIMKVIKYIDFNELSTIHCLDNDEPDFNLENVLKNIWKRFLAFHPLTKLIFKENDFFNCSTVTLKKCLIKIKSTLNCIDFDNFDGDIKGKMYEHFVNGYANKSGKEFGQYFTPRELIKLTFDLNEELFPDMKVDTIYDPAMGTAGFLTEMYRKARVNPDNIYGGELEPDTFASGLMNLLLTTGSQGNISQGNSLHNNDLLTYDWIATNPPFGTKTKYDELINLGKIKAVPKKRNGPKMEKTSLLMTEIYPIKTNDGSALFLQYCIAKLAVNGVCNIVLPDGQLLSGNAFTELRQYLVENCNVKAVLQVPGGAFKHAGVTTAVLFFTNSGEETEEIKFYETDKNMFSYKLLGVIDRDLLEYNKYSLSWKNYKNKIVVEPIDDSFEMKQLSDICKFIQGKKHNVSEGLDEGKYPLLCSSTKGKVKYLENYDYEGPYVCIGTGGAANVHLYEKFNISSHFIVLDTVDDTISIDYVYEYLNSHLSEMNDLYTGGTIKNIALDKIKEFEIPIPCIEKQKEIVNKCKEYDNSVKNTENTINDLKQQLVYIDQLYIQPLFKGEVKSLDDVSVIESGKFTTSTAVDDGKYPFYTGKAKNPSHYHNNYCFDYKEYIILTKDGGSGVGIYGDDIGLGMSYLVNGKSAATSGQLCIVPNENLIVKYLYYFLLTNKNKIMDLATYSNNLGHIKISDIRQFQIPTPDIESQQEIIDNYELIFGSMKIIDNIKNKLKDSKQTYISNCFKEVQEEL
jgi:type I restriction-modification system DNA methylase subunit/restriction endonuclease S subunit